MKLSEIRDSYHTATRKVSELTRQFAFAGIGVIWVFRGDAVIPEEGIFSDQLEKALMCFVLTLMFDLLQYLVKANLTRHVNKKAFKKDPSDDSEVIYPRKFETIVSLFYHLKYSVLIIGYIFILNAIWTLL